MSETLKIRLKAAVIFLLGVVFAACGPIDMAVFGPFRWAVRQPGAWQGALEIFVLAALVGAAAYWLRTWHRGVLIFFLCFVYARRHGVDLAIVGSLLYFEGVVSLGSFISRRLGREEGNQIDVNLIAIVTGLLTWSCIQWTMSASGFGSLLDLEIAAVAILGGALIAERRLPILSCSYAHLGRRSVPAALACAFVCSVVLMLFAKSAISIDFDSLWYGMRGDRVLVSSGSVFKGLGLVASVHYAPQAYELLIVPLSALHSVPAIFGFAIWSLAALAICLYAIGEQLGWKPLLTLTMMATALATPALLNIAITAKGDILGAFWIFFALYGFLRYRRSHDWRWLLIMLAASAVSICFRMSVFVYAGLAALLALFQLGIRMLPGSRPAIDGPLKPGLWVWMVASSLCLFFLVTARTYLLAGIPFIEPRLLVRVSESLGLIRQFPASDAPPQEIKFNAQLLPLLFDVIFRPSKLLHVAIAWTGSTFAFLLVVGTALNRFSITAFREMAIFMAMACTFFIILLSVYFPDPGGDGNYYIVPILCFVIVGMGLIGRHLLQKNLVGKSLRSALFVFVTSSILVALVTGSWGPGTRAFDFNFEKPIKDYKARSMAQLSWYGMMPVYEFLRELPKDTRVISVLPEAMDANIPDSWLPVRDESFNAINIYMPSFTKSPQLIENFLRKDAINYVMIPPQNSPDGSSEMIERVRQAVDHLESVKQAREVVKGDRFSLWEIAPQDGKGANSGDIKLSK